MRKTLIFCLPGLLLLSCTGKPRKPEPVKPGNTSQMDSTFDIQGHRGFRGMYPENSIEGFIAALDAGATTLEMDVVISADSQVVVSHEPWISGSICQAPDGTSLREQDSARYMIYQMNYEDIKGFDCGSVPHPKFPLQKKMKTYKPLLKEVVAAVQKWEKEKNKKVKYNIETKSRPEWYEKIQPPPVRFITLLYNELSALGILGQTMVQSFDVRTLQEMKKRDETVPLALLVENEKPVQENLLPLGFMPDVYSPQYGLVDDKLVEYCHKRNIQVIPWTVNDRAAMQMLIGLGVNGIITDYPDSLVSLMQR